MEGEGGLGNRSFSGGLGGIVGGALGGAVPVAAEVGKSAVSGAKNYFRNNAIGRSIGGDLGLSPETGRVVAALVGGDDPAAMRAALGRAGPDAMMGDASGRMVGALDATMQAPIPGADMARTRIAERAGAAGDDLMDALRGGQMGPYVGPIARERGVNAANRAITTPAYERAYNTPIDYATPGGAGEQIMELIGRIPSGTAKKAIDRATDQMIYDGIPNAQILAQVAEDGSVKLSQLPNVMQLDYIKKAFDELAEDGKDALTGQMTSDARFASRISRDIREATKAAVPEYGDALASGATGIRQRAAVRDGSKLLDPSFTAEQAAELIEGATAAEKKLMREGLIAQIEHKAGNVRAVASDQNIDARKALNEWSGLTSENATAKMRMLFGDEWDGIKSSIDQAGAALGLRANTSTNSRTFGRGVVDAAIDDSVVRSAIQRGKPMEAAQNLIGGLTGASPEAIARARENVRSELAELLTRQGGAPQQIMSSVAQALARNPSQLMAGNGTRRGILTGGAVAVPQVTSAIVSALTGGR